jgi:hypothetical protein
MTQEELESGIKYRVLKTNKAVIYIERGKQKGDCLCQQSWNICERFMEYEVYRILFYLTT